MRPDPIYSDVQQVVYDCLWKYRLAASESWRWIDDKYEVSTFGSVRRNGKLLKPRLNSRGYVQVGICHNNKMKWHLVHRLVASAFLVEPKLHVLHLDDKKTNNRLSNLSYGTNAKNGIDAIKTGVRNKNRPSSYFGVGWHKAASKWTATVNRKYLGCFTTEIEAAAAANRAIIETNSELLLNWLTQPSEFCHIASTCFVFVREV